MATAAGRLAPPPIGCLPPGNKRKPVLQRGLNDVRCSNEFGHEAILWRKVNLARRADLGNRALLHHHDAIAEFHGFRLIVRHIDRGDAERAQQPIELAAQAVAQRGVKRCEWFIEQQDAGPDRDRARQRHALTLAAGELIDATVFQSLDVGQRNQFGDARRALRFAMPRIFRP